MSSDPIRVAGDAIDLGGKVAASVIVVASPADATETVIAALALPSHMRPQEHVKLSAWAALAVGTDGTAVRLRIRKGTVAGGVVADTGALTGGIAATDMVVAIVEGIDAAGTDAYVLTLEVTAASAESDVSAVLVSAEIY